MGGVSFFTEHAAAERKSGSDFIKFIGREMMGNKTNQCERSGVGIDTVLAIVSDTSSSWVDDAVHNADQRGFAGTIRSEQRDDFAFLDFEIDVFECFEACGVGFTQVLYLDNARHTRVFPWQNALMSGLAIAAGP